MTSGDLTGLVLSYIYAFGLLITVEYIGKQLKWPQHFTRKIVHIGAGMWVWGTLCFFDNWYLGIIPFTTFILLNYVFYRQETFKAMDRGDSSPGTIYFAFSITLLFLLFWRTGQAVDRSPIAIAAVMAMTWGDALASILGRKYGRNPFTVFNHTRTREGTAAMFIVSFAAIFLTLYFLPGSALSPTSIHYGFEQIICWSLAASLIATTAEAISPAGTDNLSVPLLTGFVLWGLSSLQM